MGQAEADIKYNLAYKYCQVACLEPVIGELGYDWSMFQKRNLVLVMVLIIGVFLAYNSFKKIMTFRENARTVESAEGKLERLKKENEALKKDLEYKSSQGFVEGEIRNRLGLAKEGETVLILPKENDNSQSSIGNSRVDKPNWVKWRKVFFGT